MERTFKTNYWPYKILSQINISNKFGGCLEVLRSYKKDKMKKNYWNSFNHLSVMPNYCTKVHKITLIGGSSIKFVKVLSIFWFLFEHRKINWLEALHHRPYHQQYGINIYKILNMKSFCSQFHRDKSCHSIKNAERWF